MRVRSAYQLGRGSREESFILQIGQLENEPPPDAIEVDEALSRMDYRSKARPTRVLQPSMQLQLPHLHVQRESEE